MWKEMRRRDIDIIQDCIFNQYDVTDVLREEAIYL
jgi:hypothetical protein